MEETVREEDGTRKKENERGGRTKRERCKWKTEKGGKKDEKKGEEKREKERKSEKGKEKEKEREKGKGKS